MNTLLDKLKDLFSKSFVISSFLPVLVCAAVNALLLYETNERFRLFVRSQQPKGNVAAILQGGGVLFALAVIASLISPSITFFRELLEGEHWLRPFKPLREAMIAIHTTELDACEERTRKMKFERSRFDVKDKTSKLKPEEVWTADLQTAAAAGTATMSAIYSHQESDTPKLLEALRSQNTGAVVTLGDLEKAKEEVQKQLKLADPKKSQELDRLWDRFLNLVDYAKKRLEVEIIELTNERQRKWGQTGVAPTALGNRARATASYGLLRYGFSLEFGWSRLQKVLQKDTSQFGTLQDVKAGFDSVVTLFWLIARTTAGWSVYLAVFQFSLGLYLLVIGGGAIACELLYRTAVSSYAAFGDLLRSSIDLFRFDLLSALHLPLPAGLNEEQATWARLRQQTEFGEATDLRYQHPKGGAA